jgi:hypothetical protein
MSTLKKADVFLCEVVVMVKVTHQFSNTNFSFIPASEKTLPQLSCVSSSWRRITLTKTLCPTSNLFTPLMIPQQRRLQFGHGLYRPARIWSKSTGCSSYWRRLIWKQQKPSRSLVSVMRTSCSRQRISTGIKVSSPTSLTLVQSHLPPIVKWPEISR